ncbi:hypothetical protein MicB006_2870 [Micromonospora sp. B006]|nr:hypothetical protein MicB006_2870 [Micromonospora sp. B006]
MRSSLVVVLDNGMVVYTHRHGVSGADGGNGSIHRKAFGP